MLSRIFGFCLALAALTGSAHEAGAQDFSGEGNCYASLVGRIDAPNYGLLDDLILLPDADRGYYVYSDEEAKFFPFPSKPKRRSSYDLKLQWPDRPDRFFTYQYDSATPANPVLYIGYAPHPGAHYVTASPVPTDSDEARAAIRADLLDRVKRVADGFRMMSLETEEAEQEPLSLSDYSGALESCRQLGDSVIAAKLEEQIKLAHNAVDGERR